MTTASSTLTPLGAIAIFAGVPLLICAIVTVAVYVPTWRRRRRIQRDIAARQLAAPRTDGVDDPSAQPDEELRERER